MFKGNAAVAIITSTNTVKEVGRMEIAPNISVDPQTHHGAPVIKSSTKVQNSPNDQGDLDEALNAQLDET
jgi:hypothetical protein